ncbi:flagellar basal body rod protein FlgC [Cohaesibacter celericrescens]|uniref:Flagellar basal-body rod protein FlgC n=1 Tax=Cohaesibacter celericrescens TaxID=2067669 RepID=A0A2N5XXT1_9HYPH|nr:flagellar basal body rod protein FlgC [Cohaesibacter celericrescens]PLW75570.1 flagellar basal body rod protein FlgC [Cohaesibacter celericrescens]PLW79255.1 flagellar basal body rod protein FlgC [Cohaesibacter celericrescens]
MIDPLSATFQISANGMSAQSQRLRVISENLANAHSTGETAGSDPYQRKTVTFKSEMDRALGADLVSIKDVGFDKAPFQVEYQPGHPAADANGMVKLPNVNAMIELSDMREANRSYEANLKVISQTRSMVLRTIDLLRSS